MTLIKKRDVKEYFASRKRGGIHLIRPTSQPDATGFSGEDTSNADAKSEQPAEIATTTSPSNGSSIARTEDGYVSPESAKQADIRNARS